MNFWQQLKTESDGPFFVLAPMDNVTDAVFRQLVSETAAPDVLFTEFASVAGMASPAGRNSTMERLQLQPDRSHPTVAQIYGKVPEQFEAAARQLVEMGFDGIDINTGCPDKNVVKHGSGGGLIGQYDLMRDIIAATKSGAGNVPVSVKARLGLRTIATEEWVGFLLEQDLTALTVHGRTVKEMSKVPAHWDEIAKAVTLRNEIAPHTVLIGNGDIESRTQGLELAQASGVDGLMVGRGIFHDIHLFNEQSTDISDPATQLAVLTRHLELYEDLESTKPYMTLKRFFKIYVNGWYGAADLRTQLMESRSVPEARDIISLYTSNLPSAKL